MKQTHIPNHTIGAPARKFSRARILANRYGICSRTVFRFADRGLINRYRVNARLVMFADDEVAAMFESSRAGKTALVVSESKPTGGHAGAEKV